MRTEETKGKRGRKSITFKLKNFRATPNRQMEIFILYFIATTLVSLELGGTVYHKCSYKITPQLNWQFATLVLFQAIKVKGLYLLTERKEKMETH